MTVFELIKSMNIEELATYLSSNSFLNSPCYVCPYDDGPMCTNTERCTKEFRIELYKKYLRETSKYEK
jgi:hypothetical protein